MRVIKKSPGELTPDGVVLVLLGCSECGDLLIDILKGQTLERSDLLLLLELLKELTLTALSGAIFGGVRLCHLGFDDKADEVEHALLFGHALGLLRDEGLTSSLLDFLIQRDGDLIERLQAEIPKILKAEVAFGGCETPLLTRGFDDDCFD